MGGKGNSDWTTCSVDGATKPIVSAGGLPGTSFDHWGIVPTVYGKNMEQTYGGAVGSLYLNATWKPGTETGKWCTPDNYPNCTWLDFAQTAVGGNKALLSLWREGRDNYADAFSKGQFEYVKGINPLDTTTPMDDPCVTGGAHVEKWIPVIMGAGFALVVRIGALVVGLDQLMPTVATVSLSAGAGAGGYYWGKAFESNTYADGEGFGFYMNRSALCISGAIGAVLGSTVAATIDLQTFEQVAVGGVGAYLTARAFQNTVYVLLAPGAWVAGLFSGVFNLLTNMTLSGGLLAWLGDQISAAFCHGGWPKSWCDNNNNPLARQWDVPQLAAAMAYDAMSRLKPPVTDPSDKRAIWMFNAFLNNTQMQSWRQLLMPDLPPDTKKPTYLPPVDGGCTLNPSAPACATTPQQVEAIAEAYKKNPFLPLADGWYPFSNQVQSHDDRVLFNSQLGQDATMCNKYEALKKLGGKTSVIETWVSTIADRVQTNPRIVNTVPPFPTAVGQKPPPAALECKDWAGAKLVFTDVKDIQSYFTALQVANAQLLDQCWTLPPYSVLRNAATAQGLVGSIGAQKGVTSYDDMISIYKRGIAGTGITAGDWLWLPFLLGNGQIPGAASLQAFASGADMAFLNTVPTSFALRGLSAPGKNQPPMTKPVSTQPLCESLVRGALQQTTSAAYIADQMGQLKRKFTCFSQEPLWMDVYTALGLGMNELALGKTAWDLSALFTYLTRPGQVQFSQQQAGAIVWGLWTVDPARFASSWQAKVKALQATLNAATFCAINTKPYMHNSFYYAPNAINEPPVWVFGDPAIYSRWMALKKQSNCSHVTDPTKLQPLPSEKCENWSGVAQIFGNVQNISDYYKALNASTARWTDACWKQAPWSVVANAAAAQWMMVNQGLWAAPGPQTYTFLIQQYQFAVQKQPSYEAILNDWLWLPYLLGTKEIPGTPTIPVQSSLKSFVDTLQFYNEKGVTGVQFLQAHPSSFTKYGVPVSTKPPGPHVVGKPVSLQPLQHPVSLRPPTLKPLPIVEACLTYLTDAMQKANSPAALWQAVTASDRQYTCWSKEPLMSDAYMAFGLGLRVQQEKRVSLDDLYEALVNDPSWSEQQTGAAIWGMWTLDSSHLNAALQAGWQELQKSLTGAHWCKLNTGDFTKNAFYEGKWSLADPNIAARISAMPKCSNKWWEG